MSLDDLPVIRLLSYMMPEHDGDMALLEDLRERIFDYPRGEVAQLEQRWVYHAVADRLGYHPRLLGWPDPAGKLLARWEI